VPVVNEEDDEAPIGALVRFGVAVTNPSTLGTSHPSSPGARGFLRFNTFCRWVWASSLHAMGVRPRPIPTSPLVSAPARCPFRPSS